MGKAYISRLDATRIYKRMCEQTSVPMLRGVLLRGEKPGLYDSKLGGVPYWDPSMPYPVGFDGQKLMLLIQINFEQLPENVRLCPHVGMLQVFIGLDDLYGCSLMPPEKETKKNWCLIYQPHVKQDVSEADVLKLDIPTSLTVDDGPVTGMLKIRFSEPVMEPISWADCRAEGIMRKIAHDLYIEMDEDFDILDFMDCLPEDVKDTWCRTSEGLKLFGYPMFTQFDPRDENYPQYDRLLLQIDSDYKRTYKNYVLWGDLGIANFFINRYALARWDLSKVWYNWDCG